MNIPCIITRYAQERTFTTLIGECRTARDLELQQLPEEGALVEDRFPNRYAAAFFGHIDDDVLARAVANRTPFTADLSFHLSPSRDGAYTYQKVNIRTITTPSSTLNGR